LLDTLKKYIWVILAMGTCSLAQVPEIYGSLPAYPPKPEIVHTNEGPKPNSMVPKDGPSSARFVMTEYHPPQLRLLVRTSCGARVNRDELIKRAKNESRGMAAMAVNEGDVKGDKVSLWAVVSVKKWERRVSLLASDGKYVMRSNTTNEDVEWHVEPITSSGTHSSCITEENLEKRVLWEIISSALVEVWVLNKNKNPI